MLQTLFQKAYGQGEDNRVSSPLNNYYCVFEMIKLEINIFYYDYANFRHFSL